MRCSLCVFVLVAGFAPLAASAQETETVHTARGVAFARWGDFVRSELFRAAGLRCGAPARDPTRLLPQLAPSDCAYASTTPNPAHDPGTVYDIPVVFHVLQKTNGQGFVSAAQIASQVAVLNQDFGALPGSPGAPGTDVGVRFHLATVDPAGLPTTGITYSANDNWFQDGGNYWSPLAWDPHRYLNIYTNNAGGSLGYVPEIPQFGGLVGAADDRVVILWSTVGSAAPIGSPFDLGRTTTHEVGHYLGLYHTFDGGCGSLAACYSTGDLICDTEREAFEHTGCNPAAVSCGSLDPVHNYMNYSDDACMHEFTPEQIQRMRCTLENWRPLLAVPLVDCNGNGVGDATDVAMGTSLDLDGDGQPDECQALSADTGVLSVAAGGTVTLALNGGAGLGGAPYLVLGSASGTAPGLVVDGIVLPLVVPDPYFTYTLGSANEGPLAGTLGILAGDGTASASLTLAAGSPPSLIGLTLHHAFVTFDPVFGIVGTASNALPLGLAP